MNPILPDVGNGSESNDCLLKLQKLKTVKKFKMFLSHLISYQDHALKSRDANYNFELTSVAKRQEMKMKMKEDEVKAMF